MPSAWAMRSESPAAFCPLCLSSLCVLRSADEFRKFRTPNHSAGSGGTECTQSGSSTKRSWCGQQIASCVLCDSEKGGSLVSGSQGSLVLLRGSARLPVA